MRKEPLKNYLQISRVVLGEEEEDVAAAARMRKRLREEPKCAHHQRRVEELSPRHSLPEGKTTRSVRRLGKFMMTYGGVRCTTVGAAGRERDGEEIKKPRGWWRRRSETSSRTREEVKGEREKNRVNVDEDGRDVYRLFLCRGDVSGDACQRCIKDATTEIHRDYPGHKEATIWFDDCLLRCSNRSFFLVMESIPGFPIPDEKSATYPDNFSSVHGGATESHEDCDLFDKAVHIGAMHAGFVKNQLQELPE
ncbi:hypothetical protein MLD38_036760 [Melastoma candidum]|uniref:Uncharacterized protein n=1 Tax=Melastoma candidum TaxID=119954 RepID=A0ACB9LKI8_9MYRT|nr:hypothetical protein MLD38_036760 [Melastoma candidum]